MLICNMYALFVKKYGKVLKIEKNQFLSTKLDNQILDLYLLVKKILFKKVLFVPFIVILKT